jgi:hypothetical protein
MEIELLLDIRKSANIKISIEHDIEYANAYALEVLGLGLLDIISKPPKIVCHEDMPAVIHKTIGGYIMNFQEGVAVLKHKNYNGGYFWAFTYFKPVYNEDESFESFLTVRKPLPNRKLNGREDNMKGEIENLYLALKNIEIYGNPDYAQKYLTGFLEYKGYDSLTDYYMSFFDFKKHELENYFNINTRTPQKVIDRYIK